MNYFGLGVVIAAAFCSCIKLEPPKTDLNINCPKQDEKFFNDLRSYNEELFNQKALCEKNLKEVMKELKQTLERNQYLEEQTCPVCANYCEESR